MTVRELAIEIKISWKTSDMVAILAARYYKGLETKDTLKLSGLGQVIIQEIIDNR